MGYLQAAIVSIETGQEVHERFNALCLPWEGPLGFPSRKQRFAAACICRLDARLFLRELDHMPKASVKEQAQLRVRDADPQSCAIQYSGRNNLPELCIASPQTPSKSVADLLCVCAKQIPSQTAMKLHLEHSHDRPATADTSWLL